ncbi:hypothetical protein X801_06923 [Opisthorchis viverrini]|uniref:Uncharacterized protein n=1 Tax=Opisthorchis viverrini TaxID=6198 RepID=A0A1S8WSJ9_OPIVI|nr:hypothetical protein X801_06923 [Opisthorchis viverrini]
MLDLGPPKDKEMSVLDRKALTIMQNTLAVFRPLNQLRRRLLQCDLLRERYCEVMSDYLSLTRNGRKNHLWV